MLTPYECSQSPLHSWEYQEHSLSRVDGMVGSG